MKKLSMVLLALLLTVALSICAVAAPESFVNSPGATQAPEIVEYENETEDCDAELVITPYSRHETLEDTLDEMIVDAYQEIITVDTLALLNEQLAAIARNRNIPEEALAVSDLFDIHYEGCEEHENEAHGSFKIKLHPDVLRNFVGLLHFHENDWHLVESATVENDEFLVFTIDEFSPFAIVVNNSGDDSADSPLTGFIEDNLTVISLVAVMVVTFTAGIILWKKSKKQSV